MRMFKAIFIANVKEYIRDRSALFWFLVFPLIFVFIFGLVFTGTHEASYNIGIVAPSGNQIANKMIEGFKDVESFNVFIEKEDRQKELNALQKGERSIVVEIPNFDYQEINTGKKQEIPIYYDASKQQTTQMLLSVVRQMFGEAEHQISGVPRIFDLKPQSIQVDTLSDFDFILPGILAMALMQLGLFGSLQFLSLREQDIIRGLGVTPLSRGTILGSEVLLRLILGLIQTVVIISIGWLVFDVSIIGNILLVLGVVMLGSLTFISLGYMLISFVKTAEAGQGLIQVIQFPMLFLSGVFFPHELMPDFMQPIVKVLPLTYLGDALRRVMTGVNTQFSLMTDVLVLGGWLVITLIVAIKFWRWD